MEEKKSLGVHDVMELYGIGRDRAYRIMREVRHLVGNKLGRGLILRTDLLEWERSIKNESKN